MMVPLPWSKPVENRCILHETGSVALQSYLRGQQGLLRSWIGCSRVFVLGCDRRTLNKLLSRQYLISILSPSSRSSGDFLSTMLQNIVKRTGARMQHCFTPMMIRKGFEKSVLNVLVTLVIVQLDEPVQ